MRAWEVTRPAPIDDAPLELVERREPEPGPGQVRVRIAACGVCRTDLHVSEGDLPVHRPRVVPGHEVVGRVDAAGPGAGRFRTGDRVGVAWLAWTCGVCRFCRTRSRRISACGQPSPVGTTTAATPSRPWSTNATPTGCPDDLDDDQAAPLLCAGIIGYRALRSTGLPHGGRLGIYGFGGSAHITAQIALAEGASLYVATRSAEARSLAGRLGATWVGPAEPALPTPSTPPSTSPRSATSSRGPSRRSTGAGRW